MFGLAKSNSLVTTLSFKSTRHVQSVFELSRKPVLFLQVDIFMGICGKCFFFIISFFTCVMKTMKPKLNLWKNEHMALMLRSNRYLWLLVFHVVFCSFVFSFHGCLFSLLVPPINFILHIYIIYAG